MENASKALIIAGAILLSILLISLGIMVFSTAEDTTKNSGIKQSQVTTFNTKFTKYEGDNIKGSEVRSLIQEIISSNGDENNINANRVISVTGLNGTQTGTSISSSSVKTTSTYTVSITGHTDDGYINGISITLNNAKK